MKQSVVIILHSGENQIFSDGQLVDRDTVYLNSFLHMQTKCAYIYANNIYDKQLSHKEFQL